MTVNFVTMLFQDRPGKEYARWRSQKAWGSCTISTMLPRKGTV
jgi:hypothetical protein